ncbi:putative reverse transcriptase domain-containing protein [Tanacetum coccineum]
MPPKQTSQAAIAKLVADEVTKALAVDRATKNATGAGGPGNVGGAGNAGGPEGAQPAKECTFSSFIKCGPTQFHVATLGLVVANGKSWDDLKKMMFEEFCPEEEISRMEDELRNLRLKDHDIAAYTTDSTNWSYYVPMDCRGKRVATGANAEPIRVCFKCGDPNHLANSELCPERKKQGGRNASGHVYVVKDVDQAQCPNVVTSTFLLNNRYFSMLFDSGSDKKLGTFDVIIGMDWLVAHDAVIICGKKEVHIPIKNRTLVVKGDSNSSRLKVISCIKERKYIERGCHLFLAHITEKEKSEKRLEDVPVIHDFPEVFLDNLPGLPPP